MAGCRNALYCMRRLRLMLTRVARILLHGDIGPDRVCPDEQHEGLISISNEGSSTVLDLKRPDGLGPGELFLVDPLGKLVMCCRGSRA